MIIQRRTPSRALIGGVTTAAKTKPAPVITTRMPRSAIAASTWSRVWK